MDPGSQNASSPTAWHMLQVDEILAHLDTSLENGLNQPEAARRQKTVGQNELREQKTKSPFAIFIAQHKNPLVIVLWGICLISLFLNNFWGAAAIFLIILATLFLSFFLESRTERALDALKQMSATKAKVRREGRVQEMHARDVVPGDVIVLEDGDQVPADARLLGTLNLRVQEALLTGQPHPIAKTPQPILRSGVSTADRYNMVYMGSAVTHGWGEAVIVATGMDTELGQIANLLQSAEIEETPLHHQLKLFWQKVALAAGILAGAAFLTGLTRGEPLPSILQSSVVIAAAALPVSLPIVQTAVLAMGARRMLRQQALVHKLPAVEALGAVSIICSDKTGTLTENHLALTVMDMAGHSLELTETLHAGKPVLEARLEPILTEWTGQTLLLAAGALCNNSSIERVADGSDDYHAIGDPTDGAWVVAAARLGLWKPRLDRLFPRQLEVPFSSDRRRMSTIHRCRMSTLHLSEVERPVVALFNREQPYIIFCKGALNSVLEVSNRVWVDGVIQPLTPERRAQIQVAQERLAKEGMRVQGIAFRPLASRETFEDVAYSPFEKLPAGLRHLPRTHQDIPKAEEMSAEMERDLILTGFLAMVDPPRPEVLPAVLTCWEAGIRPVMITAEHPAYAVEIAHSLHITNGTPPRVLTGQELAKMSSTQLESLVDEVSIYAGVAPGNKLDIVHALQKRGHIVAITGDGVNDAPALRRSNIGVAMGIHGSEVSREAASLVILDDNFATIVRAVEEGRRVSAQVRLFVRQLLSCAAGETLILLLAPFLGFPSPFNLLQILWINLVAVGLPGLALAGLRSAKDPMRRPPDAPQTGILNRRETTTALVTGGIAAAVTLVFGFLSPANSAPGFCVFAFLQVASILALGASGRRFSELFRGSSLALPVAGLGAIVLQACAVYLPGLQKILGTTGISGPVFLSALGIGALFFLGLFLWNLDRDPAGKL